MVQNMEIHMIRAIRQTVLLLASIWVVYEHIYGIELTFKRKSKWKEQTGWFYGITHLKIGLFLIGIIMCANVYLGEIGKLKEEIYLIVYLVLLHLFLFLAFREKKMRNLLMCIPALFTAGIPELLIAVVLPTEYFDGDGNIKNVWLSIVNDVGCFLILLWIRHADKKYAFSKRIKKKEKFLVVSSVLCFAIGWGMLCGDVYGENTSLEVNSHMEFFRVLFFFGSIALAWLIGRIVLSGTKADYFEELSSLHEKNAKETLALYESYKEAQTETRKLRHDMKNHFACIQMLAKEEKYEELQEYLYNFNEAIEDISYEFQTGNDIVDAILNVKVSAARKEGIVFSVTGMLPLMPFVDAMDWCKMISNAVDNGIEALRNCSVEEKVLKIQFRDNGNFLVIHVENICEEKVQINGNSIRTEKQDKVHHGFGIKNIETAVKKYGGELQLACEHKGEQYCFRLDMLLPLHN